ncbi:MAG: bifunctional methylenetetrahydrofolate dehydrogenase/methenyltetrahydrofolate cyclohydrolase FolD [bacterium]
MSAKIIDGKAISQQIQQELTQEIAELTQSGIRPGLATILVGENPASQVYVRNKTTACEKVGIYSKQHTLPENTSGEELLELIEDLNNDPKIHGILTQLPLPGQIDESRVLNAISPAKDVDGFHPVNIGRMVTVKDFEDMKTQKLFLPCTPAGIIELLDRSNIELKGAKAVVIGRSNIVGKPVALLLLSKNATVTICHSRTKDLPAVVREADVVIAAIGRPKFVTSDMVKPGAAVIDVGINRTPEGLVGDVDFDEVSKIAGAITPVPGGVGPMTITMLLANTVKSAKLTINNY